MLTLILVAGPVDEERGPEDHPWAPHHWPGAREVFHHLVQGHVLHLWFLSASKPDFRQFQPIIFPCNLSFMARVISRRIFCPLLNMHLQHLHRPLLAGPTGRTSAKESRLAAKEPVKAALHWWACSALPQCPCKCDLWPLAFLNTKY